MRRALYVVMVLAVCGVVRGQVDAPQPPGPAAPADGVVAEFLRAGAVRYWPSKAAADAAKPSLVLQVPFMVMGPPPEAPWSSPVFSREGERYVAHVPAPPGSLFFGAGQPGAISRVSVNDGTGAMPWIVVVRPGAPVLGLLLDTTAPCEIDCGDGVTIRSTAEFPVLETLTDDAAKTAGGLAVLTGWMDLPPLWVLGYQHADSSLMTAQAVLDAARRLRAERLPSDGIWAGAAAGVGDAAAMNAELAAMGFRSLWRVPAVLGPGAPPELELKGADGAAIARGNGIVPDFTRADARQRWASDGAAELLRAGAGGLEVDTGPIETEARFTADPDIGGPGDSARYAAAYPALAARALREFFGSNKTESRPVVTTGTPAPGVQRFASLWVAAHGDDESALADSLRRVQAQSMSARFMTGMDIPGALRDSDGAAISRWCSVAALMPMLRGAPLDKDHTCAPWDFGDAVASTVRAALERRARLTPYLYTSVFEAFRFDEPVIRPAWTMDPADESLRDAPLLFLMGKSVLVDARGAGELPAAAKDWLEFDPRPGLPRLYLRPGAIIPAGPVRQHAGETPLEPLELIVALDAAGQAQGLLYEDDEEGFNYTRNQGRVAYYTAQRAEKDVLVKMARLDGGWPIAKRVLIVHILIPGGPPATGEFRDALDTHVTLP